MHAVSLSLSLSITIELAVSEYSRSEVDGKTADVGILQSGMEGDGSQRMERLRSNSNTRSAGCLHPSSDTRVSAQAPEIQAKKSRLFELSIPDSNS